MRARRRDLLADGGEGHKREQLIFMRPVPSQDGLHRYDGCEQEVG